MQRELIKNINAINNSIDELCSSINRSRDEITLIAVSKKKGFELVKLALENGINNFGENYAQELQEKSSLIDSDNIVWHFIGPIQSNKVKVIANNADWIHTLEREKIIRKFNDECKKINKVINGCIQINISSEKSKSRCRPDELFDIANLVLSIKLNIFSALVTSLCPSIFDSINGNSSFGKHARENLETPDLNVNILPSFEIISILLSS